MSKGIDYSKWDDLEDSSDEEERDDESFAAEYVEEFLTSAASPDSVSRKNASVHDALSSFETTADGWRTNGHVRVHPEDQYVEHYPLAVLEENPREFAPDPSDWPDGVVEAWGLRRPDSASDDDPHEHVRGIMAAQSARTLYERAGEEIPTVQFVRVLETRRIAALKADPVFLEKSVRTVYALKISLCDSEKDVWRRIRVPAAAALSKLHDQIFVPVLGWSRGYHGYVFEDPVDGRTLGPAKYGGYIDMMHATMHYHHVADDRKVPLAAILRKEGDFVTYTYDLGDQWTHRVELEKIVVENDHREASDVVLVDGAGACPPEDSNGLHHGKGNESYADFLRAYKKNRKKIKIKETVREIERTALNYYQPWGGSGPLRFKPLEFDLERHRFVLGLSMAGPSVKPMHGVPGGEFKESMSGCDVCGDRIKVLHHCAKCKKVSYCSRECQVEHWTEGGHKKECKRLRRGK